MPCSLTAAGPCRGAEAPAAPAGGPSPHEALAAGADHPHHALLGDCPLAGGPGATPNRSTSFRMVSHGLQHAAEFVCNTLTRGHAQTPMLLQACLALGTHTTRAGAAMHATCRTPQRETCTQPCNGEAEPSQDQFWAGNRDCDRDRAEQVQQEACRAVQLGTHRPVTLGLCAGTPHETGPGPQTETGTGTETRTGGSAAGRPGARGPAAPRPACAAGSKATSSKRARRGRYACQGRQQWQPCLW